MEDFRRGDFRRRRAQRKVRRALGLSCPGDGDDSDSPPMSPAIVPPSGPPYRVPQLPATQLPPFPLDFPAPQAPNPEFLAAFLNGLAASGLLPQSPPTPFLPPPVTSTPVTKIKKFSVASLLEMDDE